MLSKILPGWAAWENDDHPGRGRKITVSFRGPRNLLIMMVCLIVFSVTIEQVSAEDDYAETMSGMSVNLGHTYDPEDKIWFGQVTLFMLYDYDRIWPHKAPEALRFKVEGSFGETYLDQGDFRFNAGINIFALYYLTDFETDFCRPYVEAGIGGMFTDYQVTGQDYRLNFNPQAGIGIEFRKDNVPPFFLSIRLHHLSNAGIGDTNRGLNSVVCMFGRYF